MAATVCGPSSSSIVFSYLVNERYQIDYSVEPILLKGLDPDKHYQVKELNLFPGTETTINEELIYSGAYLMQVGFNPKVGASRQSVVLEFSAK